MPSMTIEVSDETYHLIQNVAHRQARPAIEFAADAVRRQAEAAERDFEETRAAIAEGIADMEAGRDTPWEQFIAEFEARHETRRRSQDAGRTISGSA